MTSHTEKECKNVKIEFSHQEEKIVSGPLGKNSFKIMFVMLLIATICIMLYYMNEIKDPNPNNNVWDMFAFIFFFGFSVAMYLFITGVIILVNWVSFKQKDQNDVWIGPVILLVFVFLSYIVFARTKHERAVDNLTKFWQTALVMDAFVLCIFFILTLMYLMWDEQKGDIDIQLLLIWMRTPKQGRTEEKKAVATKLVDKVKPRNYATMDEIENSVINV